MLRKARRLLRSNRRFMQVTRFLVLAIINQRVLIFRPDRCEWGTPTDTGIRFETEWLQAGRHRVRAWWMPRDGARVAVLLFTGRASNMSHELDTIEHLWRLGANVMAFEYPGFGASSGTATEEACQDAAIAAWNALLEKGFTPRDVILYGRSLGGAVATRLSTAAACRALVIHGCASSMRELGEHYLPRWLVRWRCRYPLDSAANIARCETEVVIMHARDDRLVPFVLARKLFDAAREPKQMIELAGDHHDGSWMRNAEVRAMWTRLIGGAT
jgi:pimeloyl-ACP methyl ester carboxylesterase